MNTIYEIIRRKKQGIDCTESESAEIKGWLREMKIPYEQPTLPDIQFYFPQEYSEFLDEIEQENPEYLEEKPKFYKAKLFPLTIKELLEITKGQNIAELMYDKEARCPVCGKTKWWIFPDESIVMREGGKPYCECINCGYNTHL